MENKKSSPNSGKLGRPRKIDRQQLLDEAETIIAQDGASALTIDALAKRLGITKGGVQYAFGTKEALIHALFERWNTSYDQQVAAIAGENPTVTQFLRAHADITFKSGHADNSKAAAMLASLVQSPEHLEPTRQWYRNRLSQIESHCDKSSNARLAFLAIEGAFTLRYFGFCQLTEEEWEKMHTDILQLL
ncbi:MULTISPECIES: TetR/AcrR family transcriptional regulator [unclassified Rhizobium]|uniref:TetR/AcrR family transcriptional regulator n=1 Tax=unclassified Rhizobium TaxID=2613769 RepID=UPI0017817144|nr:MULTISPECIES: TetR/AcrR family transcriptional regulator [unclassified Rhizobium]MBD8687155.1 TetR family transcriptional regulator [Rhizobium sp. CFBP 13644]MBD8691042.1 TetR family transcriptional regulator [Rhizobium sp. CFBP 13717]